MSTFNHNLMVWFQIHCTKAKLQRTCDCPNTYGPNCFYVNFTHNSGLYICLTNERFWFKPRKRHRSLCGCGRKDTNQTCAGDLLSIRKQAKTAVCTFTNILFSVSLINYNGVFLSCCITALYMTKKHVSICFTVWKQTSARSMSLRVRPAFLSAPVIAGTGPKINKVKRKVR